MPRIQIAPLTKITLNLFEKDVELLKKFHDNYTIKIRDIVHDYCRKRRHEGLTHAKFPR